MNWMDFFSDILTSPGQLSGTYNQGYKYGFSGYGSPFDSSKASWTECIAYSNGKSAGRQEKEQQDLQRMNKMWGR